MKKLALVFAVGLVSAVWAGPFGVNLVTNPGAETGNMSGWTIVANGGNGWAAIDTSYYGNPHSGSYCFGTSYDWDTRYQVINLLAAGFTAAELDSAPPVVFQEYTQSRPDAGCSYFIRFELRNGAGNVMAFWEHGTQNNPVVLPAGVPWFAESHTFTGYGPGLRYLAIIDGGKDNVSWAGWYGAYFDDASAMLVPEPASLALLGLAWGLLLLKRR
jgi:hypothetical protein